MSEPLILPPDVIETVLARTKFNAQGLVPAIAQDVRTGEVLMLAYMNAEALRTTLSEGQACYWSRSRGKLWRKGETSGHVSKVVGALLDCDGDTVLLHVEQTGPACHTNARHCFFQDLTPTGMQRAFDVPNPDEAHADLPAPDDR